jgi:hypothetical protein
MVSDWYRIETKKAGIAHHYNEGQSLLRKYINTANALLIDLYIVFIILFHPQLTAVCVT